MEGPKLVVKVKGKLAFAVSVSLPDLCKPRDAGETRVCVTEFCTALNYNELFRTDQFFTHLYQQEFGIFCIVATGFDQRHWI
jgi:hypothetical protein